VSRSSWLPPSDPILGGWLSDNVSWQSCFLINGPVGAVAMVLVYMLVKEVPADRSVRFDWVGFTLVAAFLGALEFILDRGQQDDWFGSNVIITFTCISALAVLLLIRGQPAAAIPFIDLGMITTRQFGSCFLVMLATGAILLATTQFLPQLVQGSFGYTATWAGLCSRRAAS